MDGMVVVYESSEPFWVEEAMDALREEGFHPTLADDAGALYYSMDNKSPGITGMPQGRMKVRIVVPREEEAAARFFLRKRGEQATSHVAEQTGRLRRPLVLSMLGTAVAFIIMACSSDEPANCLGIALLLVLPASFILTANSHNVVGQICAPMVVVAAVVGGMYCFDKALVYTGCFLSCLPFVGIAYIFFRTHKFVLTHKKDDSF